MISDPAVPGSNSTAVNSYFCVTFFLKLRTAKNFKVFHLNGDGLRTCAPVKSIKTSQQVFRGFKNLPTGYYRKLKTSGQSMCSNGRLAIETSVKSIMYYVVAHSSSNNFGWLSYNRGRLWLTFSKVRLCRSRICVGVPQEYSLEPLKFNWASTSEPHHYVSNLASVTRDYRW